MALVVEDGTGIDGANTFVSLADCEAYSLARGLDISGDEDATSAMILTAMDYLAPLSWKGEPVEPFQVLPWPRNYVYLGRNNFPNDQVPPDVVAAQCQLVMNQFNGVVLFPATETAMIIQDTVGPLTTKYSPKYGAPTTPTLPLVDQLLDKWLTDGGGLTLRSVRV